ncbi:hypothetical protein [Amphritea sp. HPY]|uniref:hypothetical protein n=1 Tax=Amphritea sp. HPY TaxID=3421652 RepID=UPI003D7DD37E
MQFSKHYLSFWQHLFNQVGGLLGDLTFKEFIDDPWAQLASLRDPSKPQGMLLALCKKRIYVSTDQLPPLEYRLDLAEISHIAEELFKWSETGDIGSVKYVLH